MNNEHLLCAGIEHLNDSLNLANKKHAQKYNGIHKINSGITRYYPTKLIHLSTVQWSTAPTSYNLHANRQYIQLKYWTVKKAYAKNTGKN